MRSLLDIRLQKLFLVTLVLKVGFSFCGWYLQLSWSLGFAVPLFIMTAYIVLGYHRRETDVPDEKFADSCYYLGFIFTFTSIIFCLFDLPNIGTKIQFIAVRFGAAMVSTVLGLGVRVYLVTFRRDIGDAIQDAEDAVLQATERLTERLTIALERLQDFESRVDTAAESSVERVNIHVENLSRNHAEKLATFFADLTSRNQHVSAQSLAEVETAGKRLSGYVDDYSLGVRANLTSIEAKVVAFTEAVTNRLKTTTFPDDFFAKHLNAPLAQMKDSADVLASGVKVASSEVIHASGILAVALQTLHRKASAAEGSLDAVLKLTVQQQAVLDSAHHQLTTLGQLTSTLEKLDSALAGTTEALSKSNTVTSEMTARVSSVVTESATARKALDRTLVAVIGKLDLTATSTGMVAERVDVNATAAAATAARMADQLEASTAAVSRLIARVNTVLALHPRNHDDSGDSQLRFAYTVIPEQEA